jgi:hypothetical protein
MNHAITAFVDKSCFNCSSILHINSTSYQKLSFSFIWNRKDVWNQSTCWLLQMKYIANTMWVLQLKKVHVFIHNNYRYTKRQVQVSHLVYYLYNPFLQMQSIIMECNECLPHARFWDLSVSSAKRYFLQAWTSVNLTPNIVGFENVEIFSYYTIIRVQYSIHPTWYFITILSKDGTRADYEYFIRWAKTIDLFFCATFTCNFIISCN